MVTFRFIRPFPTELARPSVWLGTSWLRQSLRLAWLKESLAGQLKWRPRMGPQTCSIRWPCIKANELTEEMIRVTRMALEEVGIDPSRLRHEYISASEGAKYAARVDDFSRCLTELGPIGLTGEQQERLAEWKLNTAPCQYACPIGTEVPAYVSLIADGRFAEAMDVFWCAGATWETATTSRQTS